MEIEGGDDAAEMEAKMAHGKRFTYWHAKYGMCAILSSGQVDERGVHEVCIVESESGHKYRVYEDELEYTGTTRHEDDNLILCTI